MSSRWRLLPELSALDYASVPGKTFAIRTSGQTDPVDSVDCDNWTHLATLELTPQPSEAARLSPGDAGGIACSPGR